MSEKRPSTSVNRIIAVTGMTGAGKDYVVDRANGDGIIRKYGWGDMLEKVLGRHKDEMMDVVDPRVARAGQFKVCNQLIALQPAVVTCHAIRLDASGKYVYDFEVEELLNPTAYIFVKASAEVISKRVRERNQNSSRRSVEIPVDKIDEIQAIKLDAIKDLTDRRECPLHILENTEQKEVEVGVKVVRGLFEDITHSSVRFNE